MFEMSFMLNGVKMYDRLMYVGQDLTKAIEKAHIGAKNIELVRVIKCAE
jgi:hypothetical protein